MKLTVYGTASFHAAAEKFTLNEANLDISNRVYI